MQRLISWLIRIAAVLLLLAGASYAAAQYRARQVLGPNSPIRGPSTTFVWKGVQNLPGKPRSWVLTYSTSRLPDVQRVRIVVSPSGTILSVTPPDLRERLDAYRQSLEP
jgi:hypothetical protein